MLGLPGDYTEEPCRDCYATKVGGRPAPPAGVPAGALSRVCGLCKGEMRLVLRAMDQQKAAATRNMQQLSKIYDDWSHASNM